jgi:CHASE3 domain sensor protein
VLNGEAVKQVANYGTQGDNMFTTPQDYFKAVQDTFAALPKTPEDVKATLEKTKNVIDAEAANVKEVISTYNKASTGDASINEISLANKKAKIYS